jgi:hypothetical protein
MIRLDAGRHIGIISSPIGEISLYRNDSAVKNWKREKGKT